MTDRSDGLNQVLAELRAAADRPPERAVSAPPALYNRADVLDLEIERIFRKGWACAGFAAEIPNPGDYLTYSIVDQPVVVIRGDDGEVRAFSNVCRHRMAVLLEGRGAARRLICPYHAWTYGLDGGLIGAGHMERTACFDRGDYALPAVRCEVWNGFIYLTLNPDARGMAETLAPLEPVVARYDMAGYLPVLHQEQTWDTNWKVLVENFMEGYHGPVAHKATVGFGMSLDDTAFPGAGLDGLTYSTFTKPEDAPYGVAHPDNTRLDGVWRRTAVLPTVFPAHMYSLSPDYLWYLSLRPRGVDQVDVRIGVAVAPEVLRSTNDRPAFLEALQGFFDQVNAEDRAIVERVYQGSRAPLARSGPLSWLEQGLHDFVRYLASALAEPEGVR